MSPQRMTGPAFWASGGEIAGRHRWLDLAEAGDLMGFYQAAGRAAQARRDAAAEQFCRSMAEELAQAMRAAAAWRRAAAGAG